MQAVVNERYGSPDILDIREIATPEPKAGEILVKVHATTVGRTDSCALRAYPFFLRLYTIDLVREAFVLPVNTFSSP